MTYFIIGGAGFIGSNFAKYLFEKGKTVFINDDFSNGSKENLNGINYTHCNIEEGIEKCDYIIHLAGSVGVNYVNNNPTKTIYNNINLEKKIFTINSKFNKPLLFASTSEVYGNSKKFPFNEDQDLSIGISTQKRWGYACSKLMGEFLGLHSSFPCVVVRFFNITGPGQLCKWVIPKFVYLSSQNKTIEIYNEKAVRCFCHVEDTVEAMYKLINNKNCYNKIFNIGNPNTMISMENLAKKIVRKIGSGYIKKVKNLEKNVDVNVRIPNIDKIKNYIKWKPEKTLDDIINDIGEYII